MTRVPLIVCLTLFSCAAYAEPVEITGSVITSDGLPWWMTFIPAGISAIAAIATVVVAMKAATKGGKVGAEEAARHATEAEKARNDKYLASVTSALDAEILFILESAVKAFNEESYTEQSFRQNALPKLKAGLIVYPRLVDELGRFTPSTARALIDLYAFIFGSVNARGSWELTKPRLITLLYKALRASWELKGSVHGRGGPASDGHYIFVGLNESLSEQVEENRPLIEKWVREYGNSSKQGYPPLTNED